MLFVIIYILHIICFLDIKSKANHLSMCFIFLISCLFYEPAVHVLCHFSIGL